LEQKTNMIIQQTQLVDKRKSYILRRNIMILPKCFLIAGGVKLNAKKSHNSTFAKSLFLS